MASYLFELGYDLFVDPWQCFSGSWFWVHHRIPGQ
jgi:hypothetical protein